MSHLSIDRVALRHLLANLDRWGLFVDETPEGFLVRWYRYPDPVGKFPQYLKSTVPPYTKPFGRDQEAHDSRRDMEVATSALWSRFPEAYVKHYGFRFHTKSEAEEALKVVNKALELDNVKRESFNRLAAEKKAFSTWVEVQDSRNWPQGIYVRSLVTIPTQQLQKLSDLDPKEWERLRGLEAKTLVQEFRTVIAPQVEGDILQALDRERGHLDTLEDTVYKVNNSRPPKWDLMKANPHTTTLQIQLLVSSD